ISHGGGQRLEVGSSDYQILAEWIASGAPRPPDDDPQIQRPEVLPPAAVLRPKDRLPVIVPASDSDGRARDVTHWAKFNSSEDLVATVDQEGLATVAGHGEAAITVWYSNLVASARVVVPLANRIDMNVFSTASRHSYIDDLVLKKLEALHIP